ncbi:MAG: hypothetical protein COB49_10910 [Alphaproteobacteria bacterium]|nr:MAG: hypothetical protein COB49_10910 [Alphaproteobacteria bacterium]
MEDRPVYRKNFDSDAISMEAASWVLQLDNGPLSKADLEALREWAGRSPAHAQALREYASAWISIDDILLEANEAENAAYQFSWWSPLAMIFNRRFFRIWTPAAAVLVAIFYLSTTFYLPPSTPDFEATAITYSTQIGEQAQFKMADGSTVHLNTGSVVEVEYQPSRRIVRLLKGEALFSVAHDPSRPFDVIANEKKITAVGTAFVVRLTDVGLNITVTEGSVVVIPALTDTAQKSGRNKVETGILAILEPNEKMIVEHGNVVIEKVKEDVIVRQLSWREGVLIFEDDSLVYVINEVSRYTDTKIVLAAEIEELRIGGLFKIGEIEALLNALEVSFDLQATRMDENTFYLSLRDNAEEDS